MEKYRAFAVEGLDGTGKSTTTKLLAAETNSRYYHWSEKNSLIRFKHLFQNKPLLLQFFFHVMTGADTHVRVNNMLKTSDVYVDRSMVSTIAYYKAMGIPDYLIAMIPKVTLDIYDRLLYFTADEQTRLERMEFRETSGEKAMTPRDRLSLVIGNKVDQAYRGLMPEKTHIIDTNKSTVREVVDALKMTYYEPIAQPVLPLSNLYTFSPIEIYE